MSEEAKEETQALDIKALTAERQNTQERKKQKPEQTTMCPVMQYSSVIINQHIKKKQSSFHVSKIEGSLTHSKKSSCAISTASTINRVDKSLSRYKTHALSKYCTQPQSIQCIVKQPSAAFSLFNVTFFYTRINTTGQAYAINNGLCILNIAISSTGQFSLFDSFSAAYVPTLTGTLLQIFFKILCKI